MVAVRSNDRCVVVSTHRAMFEAVHGTIPPGAHLHHECSVPSRTNPGHARDLDATSHAQHHIEQRRHRRTTQRKGHRAPGLLCEADPVPFLCRSCGVWCQQPGDDDGLSRPGLPCGERGRGGSAPPVPAPRSECGYRAEPLTSGRLGCSGTCLATLMALSGSRSCRLAPPVMPWSSSV